MARLPSPTRPAIARQFVEQLSQDQLKQVLATTSGDFHHDVLSAFAKNLTQDPEERKAVIEALQLSPEDVAQLR